MRGTDTQVENPSPCHEQLFLSGLCVDSRVIQQVLIVDFRCVKKHHFLSSFFSLTFTFQLLDKPWSHVSSLLSPGSCLQFLSRIFHRAFLTHALALSASQSVHKRKSQ